MRTQILATDGIPFSSGSGEGVSLCGNGCKTMFIDSKEQFGTCLNAFQYHYSEFCPVVEIQVWIFPVFETNGLQENCLLTSGY
jgi:hypothetical protein